MLFRRADGVLAVPAYRKGWHYFLVDRQDAWVCEWNWFLNKDGYAQRNFNCRSDYLHRAIHRQVENIPDGKYVDHRNRNKLDCRRKNLRLLDASASTRNTSTGSARYMVGVTFDPDRELWAARIKHEGKTIYVGRFKNPTAAVMARRRKLVTLGLPIDPQDDHATQLSPARACPG